MDKVIITKRMQGLLHMQVCAESGATDEEILSVCNGQNPAGTSQGWCHVIRDDEEHPESNPVACKDEEGRTHFLINC